MKAYALDLRERVVKFVSAGGSKAEAARRFDLGWRTVYRYLAAAQKGVLSPKRAGEKTGCVVRSGQMIRGHWDRNDAFWIKLNDVFPKA